MHEDGRLSASRSRHLPDEDLAVPEPNKLSWPAGNRLRPGWAVGRSSAADVHGAPRREPPSPWPGKSADGIELVSHAD